MKKRTLMLFNFAFEDNSDLSYHHVNFPFDGNIEREAVLTLHLYYRYIK